MTYLGSYERLLEKDPEKSSSTRVLAQQIDQILTLFFANHQSETLTAGAYQKFKKDFELALHHNDEMFSGSGASYKIALVNITSALEEIGELFERGTLTSSSSAGSAACFFKSVNAAAKGTGQQTPDVQDTVTTRRGADRKQ